MKAIHFLVIILLLAGCDKDGDPVPQLSANFASTFIGIVSSEQDRSVSIELNRIPLFPTIVEVKLTNADGTAHGWTILPIRMPSTIRLKWISH